MRNPIQLGVIQAPSTRIRFRNASFSSKMHQKPRFHIIVFVAISPTTLKRSNQSRSQSPRYPYPAPGKGNNDLWDCFPFLPLDKGNEDSCNEIAFEYARKRLKTLQKSPPHAANRLDRSSRNVNDVSVFEGFRFRRPH